MNFCDQIKRNGVHSGKRKTHLRLSISVNPTLTDTVKEKVQLRSDSQSTHAGTLHQNVRMAMIRSWRDHSERDETRNQVMTTEDSMALRHVLIHESRTAALTENMSKKTHRSQGFAQDAKGRSFSTCMSDHPDKKINQRPSERVIGSWSVWVSVRRRGQMPKKSRQRTGSSSSQSEKDELLPWHT